MNKATGECGKSVHISGRVSHKVEHQAVYKCNAYPQPATQKALGFLTNALDILRKKN